MLRDSFFAGWTRRFVVPLVLYLFKISCGKCCLPSSWPCVTSFPSVDSWQKSTPSDSSRPVQSRALMWRRWAMTNTDERLHVPLESALWMIDWMWTVQIFYTKRTSTLIFSPSICLAVISGFSTRHIAEIHQEVGESEESMFCVVKQCICHFKDALR